MKWIIRTMCQRCRTVLSKCFNQLCAVGHLEENWKEIFKALLSSFRFWNNQSPNIYNRWHIVIVQHWWRTAPPQCHTVRHWWHKMHHQLLMCDHKNSQPSVVYTQAWSRLLSTSFLHINYEIIIWIFLQYKIRW